MKGSAGSSGAKVSYKNGLGLFFGIGLTHDRSGSELRSNRFKMSTLRFNDVFSLSRFLKQYFPINNNKN